MPKPPGREFVAPALEAEILLQGGVELYRIQGTFLEHPMALSIKDEETDRLARALAAATGESLTEAIRRALEERLARETRRGGAYPLAARVRRVQERMREFPVLDVRSDEELLGYDEHGLPR
ncbi:MAG TPA: type II toxin-antitoxin system VapB family antitoxin [Gemmatimonadaceae bacterium]|jgi:antitoxin VapB|nr:type II toxin-antitoxin system VapB family antitoxin [Gemmatimonadaceae bacterium]